MDGGRLLIFLFLMCVLIIEVVLGGPKCSGRWAIHSCAGGNGKRSDVKLPEDVEVIENALPGFESSEEKITDGRTEDAEDYETQLENYFPSSFSSSSSSSRRNRLREDVDAEYDERLERAWNRIIYELVKKKSSMDYDYRQLPTV